MIRRVTIKNFKCFREHTFELADSVVLAGPNNAGKSTLLQAIATWKLGLDRWTARREGEKPSKAVKRPGFPITRADFTPVPLRHINLLWHDRRVSGETSNKPRLIEIIVEGDADGETWECGMEFQYTNAESAYVRPWNAKELSREELLGFPPSPAAETDVVHVPPLSGIARDEPRHDRGMQDLLIGQGQPGRILRNLLLEIAEKDGESWDAMAAHVRNLFGIEVIKPSYTPAQPHILCEYREPGLTKPLDLSNAGSGTLQVLLLLAFLYARPATVILLDEPDAHQHVILQKQVYDLIRKVTRERGGQVIVATHSEVVLDSTEPTRVLGFFGQTPRVLAGETERDAIREALKRVTTTDLVLGDEIGAVLYVEGESDERILTEWARILDHPARRFFKRPFTHWLGGRSLREASAHFFAMRAAFPDMRAVCLLDGDNRDEPDEETKKTGLVVLRWRRYEIENYLLHPGPIKRFINFPLKENQVEEEFWKQVPRGADLFGDHVSLERVKGGDEFLVPLLESLRADTPKRDLYSLAATMTRDEIHPEITEKLDRIAETFNLNAPEERP